MMIGIIALEIGYNQKDDIIEIIEETRKYKNIYCKKDLFENDRVIVFRKV